MRYLMGGSALNSAIPYIAKVFMVLNTGAASISQVRLYRSFPCLHIVHRKV